MQRLRNLGVYQLPNGKQCIALANSRDGYHLYSQAAWEQYDLADYEVGAEGQLLRDGRPTPWRIEDLSDTGQTAHDNAKPWPVGQAGEDGQAKRL
ncbi:MAG TPA: hypothetical protein VD966_09600 [Pyrinomonadaceae bacterium]|nr:hypothetical protein [Pyrinomonadaceae bacterium]